MLALSRLPGIRVDASPPPPSEALPRMDVAVFVGFAAMGPVHVPVAIESVTRYTEIFGSEVPLAFDAERGERVWAYLDAAIRGFFSNGGQRCWVIRVARTLELEDRWRQATGGTVEKRELAEANRYAVSGVLMLSGDGSKLDPAEAQARSLGSWSDGLRLQTALVVSSFEVRACRFPLDADVRRFGFLADLPLQAGDLIELYDSTVSDTPGIKCYATVDSVSGTLPRWMEATLRAAFKPITGSLYSPPSPLGEVEILGIPGTLQQATLEIVTGDSILESEVKISFSMAGSSGPGVGQWIRWKSGNTIIWLRIDRLSFRPKKEQQGQTNFEAAGSAWRELTKAELTFPIPAPTRAASLTLDLRVLAEQTNIAHLTNVGLTTAHHNAWWRQVSDAVYYTPPVGLIAAPVGFKPFDASARFPLAARDEERGIGAPMAWIPLGVTALFGEALAPLQQAATPLERDGLSRFDAELFLDPELASLNTDQLIAQADAIRFFAEKPRVPLGIHAALSIGSGGMYNEASLIAVPDALHIGWEKRLLAKPLAPPSVQTKIPAHWHTHRGLCAAIPAGIELNKPDFGRFLDCSTRKLETPSWKNPQNDASYGNFQLEWKWQDTGLKADFLLEEARRADFGDAREIYIGSEQRFDVSVSSEGIFYYRITAIMGDESSSPSEILPVAVRDNAWVSRLAADYAESGAAQLLSIHRAVLRLAAASGELFAVLGLPCHYRSAEAIRHAASLQAARHGQGADLSGFDFNERRALSYGALYHPWIVFAAPSFPGFRQTFSKAQRSCPPNGIVTGLLASRASRRGAWIAPANELFRDVSALTPPIEPNVWQALQDAQINLVQADARGFLTLAADTLADEPELRPINVRRLLILLRRLALRRGTSYVFEPNDDILRRAVERGFNLMLVDLFRRGAFAGATEEQSFQVVAGESINRAIDREAGRFFVELRVAPALPLRFLTVRLVQSGERLTVREEA
ncbi:hypothetical protein Nit79A3_1006 [Nitrosomonas sp. Is79A3]